MGLNARLWPIPSSRSSWRRTFLAPEILTLCPFERQCPKRIIPGMYKGLAEIQLLRDADCLLGVRVLLICLQSLLTSNVDTDARKSLKWRVGVRDSAWS